MKEEEIRQYLEDCIKPKLGVELKKFLPKDYWEQEVSDSLRQDIKDALVEQLDRYCDTEVEHVKIEVSATPEQIENHEWTVTFTALDEMGVEFIKDMGTAIDDN